MEFKVHPLIALIVGAIIAIVAFSVGSSVKTEPRLPRPFAPSSYCCPCVDCDCSNHCTPHRPFRPNGALGAGSDKPEEK